MFIKDLIISELKHQTKENQNGVNEEFLDLEQACDILHYSKATVYALVENRSIPHYKKSRKILFSKDELLEWLKSGRRKTKKELENEAENYLLNTKKNKTFNE